MKKSLKQQWIEAIKLTIEQYQNGTHEGNCASCHLCQLSVSIRKRRRYVDDDRSCEDCVLHNTDIPTIKEDQTRMSCIRMLTYPRMISDRSEKTRQRIKFWKQALRQIEQTPEHNFWPSNRNKHLVRALAVIDQKIAYDAENKK